MKLNRIYGLVLIAIIAISGVGLNSVIGFDASARDYTRDSEGVVVLDTDLMEISNAINHEMDNYMYLAFEDQAYMDYLNLCNNANNFIMGFVEDGFTFDEESINTLNGFISQSEYFVMVYKITGLHSILSSIEYHIEYPDDTVGDDTVDEEDVYVFDDASINIADIRATLSEFVERGNNDMLMCKMNGLDASDFLRVYEVDQNLAYYAGNSDLDDGEFSQETANALNSAAAVVQDLPDTTDKLNSEVMTEEYASLVSLSKDVAGRLNSHKKINTDDDSGNTDDNDDTIIVPGNDDTVIIDGANDTVIIDGANDTVIIDGVNDTIINETESTTTPSSNLRGIVNSVAGVGLSSTAIPLIALLVLILAGVVIYNKRR